MFINPSNNVELDAQHLYDARELYGQISGQELHEVFLAVCGDPSPSGRTKIDLQALRGYASAQRSLYAAHKQRGGVGGEYLLDIAGFCEAFI